jgi:hypothetical protein
MERGERTSGLGIRKTSQVNQSIQGIATNKDKKRLGFTEEERAKWTLDLEEERGK